VGARVFDGGAVAQEWDDDTRTYRRWDDGVLVEEREYDEDEAAPLAEAEACEAREEARESLLDKVDAAIEADLAYLDLNPPTTAQAVAQVARLTRQTVALLRLVGARLDDTTGT